MMSGTALSSQQTSKVEEYFLQLSGREWRYEPTEKINVIEVPNFPSLGKLTALRFLEWVQANPEGVISLPTGKTPEYFIKWTKHYLEDWDTPEVKQELTEIGLDVSNKPDLSKLYFVQIDEFYPIDPAQKNSFHYYVTSHYLKDFGLDLDRALLIDPTAIGIPEGETINTIFPDGHVDLELRHRHAHSPLEKRQLQTLQRVDQFCSEYEARIRELGGIGFFLGGIGPDGHIGFNARGSHLNSPTRLTLTNYETEAAAASDLGGIEISRHKPVITIGLGTISHKKDAVVIIFAAGDAKAGVVSDAIQKDQDVLYPASVMHDLPNARFYLTSGATVQLIERRIDDILKAEEISAEAVERAVIDRSITLNKRLDKLEDTDVGDDRFLKAVLDKSGRNIKEVAGWGRENILTKIKRGLETLDNQAILHTGPHHDDIMLGYMPYIMHLVRDGRFNKNYYNVLTSGFTAVTNDFISAVFQDVINQINDGWFDEVFAAGDFEPNNDVARAADVYLFLDGIAAMNEHKRDRAQARRMIYNLIHMYELKSLDEVKAKAQELIDHLATQYPGEKNRKDIQTLKGMQREYEEELIWGYVGSNPSDVFHSRLGFYTGDIFTQQPTIDRDVKPFIELLEKLHPTIVSVTFDPEGSGPDTHYKVLQVIAEGLKRYAESTGKKPTVWGYRNVWYRFHPAETNIFIPATLNTMSIMENSFMNCFGSQKNASFPSHSYDGPFCYVAQNLWVEQFTMLKACLGHRFFIDNTNPRLRATRGYLFMKEMSLEEFTGSARALAQATEAAD
jgi:glucosamine-6-phosphate deaminase